MKFKKDLKISIRKNKIKKIIKKENKGKLIILQVKEAFARRIYHFLF